MIIGIEEALLQFKRKLKELNSYKSDVPRKKTRMTVKRETKNIFLKITRKANCEWEQ